ncbi:MAG: response regulator transcription factor [Polyangiaceae bacterium]|nr:response regulator transcription factor [Polyangiaceae bacterium]
MATEVLERLRQTNMAHPAEDAFATLTPQEDHILELIADGLTNAEIASELLLAEKTIRNYVTEIYAKLSIARRSQAARLATERRLRKSDWIAPTEISPFSSRAQ